MANHHVQNNHIWKKTITILAKIKKYTILMQVYKFTSMFMYKTLWGRTQGFFHIPYTYLSNAIVLMWCELYKKMCLSS